MLRKEGISLVWGLDEVDRLSSCSFGGEISDVSSLAFSPDGRLLASGSRDGEVRLWDLENFQLRA